MFKPSLDEPATTVRSAASILLIEDEECILAVLREALHREYRISVAMNGREALELLSRSDACFDAILCDVLMPERNGLEFYRALKLARPGEEKRILFATGGVLDPEFSEFLAQITNPVIQKPFRLSFIRTLLRDFTAHAPVAPPPQPSANPGGTLPKRKRRVLIALHAI